MALIFNIRHLQDHALHFKGELPVAELDFGVQDELIHLKKPLAYDLAVELLHDSILVTGKLKLTLDCECSRCLKAFKFELNMGSWALHLPLEGEDKVSIVNDCVDLTPYVREDMLLEFPQRPLCKSDCDGLKKSKNVQAEGDDDKSKPDPWAELNKLKLK